jgi:hypothetical protein
MVEGLQQASFLTNIVSATADKVCNDSYRYGVCDRLWHVVKYRPKQAQTCQQQAGFNLYQLHRITMPFSHKTTLKQP